MKVSCTRYYRADGTISSIALTENVVFKSDSGQAITQPVTRQVPAEEWLKLEEETAAAYLATETHIKDVEAKCADMRKEMAAQDEEHAKALSVLKAEIEAKNKLLVAMAGKIKSVMEVLA